MEMSQEDFDRILSFDQARRDSEALYAVNPDDADNLTRWGEALLELSHLQDADCCVEMIEDAVSKLEKALLVDPTKHETLWCLGNAHTSRGFCTTEHELAKVYFGFAAQCYENALQEDPGNKMYAKSLEMALKGPELHLELQSQSRSQQASVGGSSVSNAKGSKEQSGDDELMYDIFGWVILVVGLIACVAMSSSQAPPPPSTR